ncbi:MAG: cytochrome c biogenesis protein CcsA [Chloroflexi bacterium]|nr:cytochrome c biogenesis protein CcsA [Chloroflexota bacterium]
MRRQNRLFQGFIGLTALLTALALCLVFLVAPREAVMGDVQRIFYFHVASSWTGYLALFVTFIAGLLYLRRRESTWDRLGLASAEIGWIFITGGILTGTFWAKTTWGVWWTWDPRLTTSAVLWLIYASYLILRQAMEDRNLRARVAAVYGIAGFAAVPLNFMAIRWWRAAHPLVLQSSGIGLTPSMLRILIFSVLTFTLFYIVLLCCRVRLERAGEQLSQLRRYRREG